MQVIGVVDIRGGQAVHARGGQRDSYAPVSRVAGSSIEPGDARALAQAYVNTLGVSDLYIADLDAIVHGTPQDALIQSVATVGTSCWLDSGITSVDDARRALNLGVSGVIVGLETLTSFEALHTICEAVGGARVAFSLDIREGQPVTTSPAMCDEPEALAIRAVDAGAQTVIVLDLLRVGANAGPGLDLIARIRARVPTVRLIAGGGVRGVEDLASLEKIGCDGVLVATALLNGLLNL